MAIDPGETTGVAIWDPEKGQVELTQWETKDVGTAYGIFEDLVELYRPGHVRVEEYRVYSWMAQDHAWSILHTPQLIGALKVLAYQHNLDMSFKLAQHAKAMWTDNNLKRCSLYSPGQKHARDASRHLFYYMAKPQDKDA